MAKKKTTRSAKVGETKAETPKRPALTTNGRTELEIGVLAVVARNQLRILPYRPPTVRTIAAELGRPLTTVFQAIERLHEAELLAERPRPHATLTITDMGFMVLDAYDMNPATTVPRTNAG